MAVHLPGNLNTLLTSTSNAPELLLDAPFTIGMWLRAISPAIYSNTTNYFLGLEKQSNQGSNGALGFAFGDKPSWSGGWGIYCKNTANSARPAHGGGFGVDNTWRLFVLAINANRGMNVYACDENQSAVNVANVSIGNDDLTNNSPGNNGKWLIGNSHITDRAAKIDIAQFFSINRELTAAEITTLGTGSLISDLGYTPINYYKLDDNNDLLDYGTAGNDLIKTGNPTTVAGPSVLVPSNTRPSIALNTANNFTTQDQTPPLLFTGSDAEGDDLQYQIQIDTTPTFDSGLGSL